ncbi:MAG: TolC family protein [Candidatus Methylacidiphilales bacterium]
MSCLRTTAATFCLILVSVCTAVAQNATPSSPPPLTWRECVDITLQHNTDIRSAATRLEEAVGARLEFRSRALPQVSGTAITFPPLVLLDVRQMVFDQRAMLAWKASRLTQPVARLNYEVELNKTLTTLRIAYLNVIFLQEQRQMTQELQSFIETRRINAQSMFDSGQLQRSELQQVEVRAALVRDALVLLDDRIQSAQSGLLRVMGTGTEIGPLVDSYETIPRSPVDRQKVLQMAQTSLPELLLLDKLIEAGNYQIRITRADRYPNVYLYGRAEFSPGTGGFLSEKRSENAVTQTATAAGGVGGALTGGGTGGAPAAVDPTKDTTGLGDVNTLQTGSTNDDEFEKSRGVFGLQLSWQPLDGGRTTGKTVKRVSERDRDETLAEEVRANLPGQVDEAWQQIETTRQLLQQASSLPDFGGTIAMARDEYEGQRASHNETLSLVLDQFAFQSRLQESKYRANVALTFLRRLSGQLLAFAGETNP